MGACDDPHDLERFVAAQAADHAVALAELRAGRKRTHWMWYVLPQLRGLGTSPMARRYGLAGLDEARAYLAHPLLGPRLLDCVAALNALPGDDAAAVLGGIDALKLHSCLTLYARAAGASAAPFRAALAKYYGGVEDTATLALLGAAPPAP
jgi:uncharacterized protein (DUF1810 family)